MTNNIPQTNKKTYSYNMRSAVINYYLVAMFAVFPMFLTDQFARARRDKYLLFSILTIVLTAAVLIISLMYIGEKKNKPNLLYCDNDIKKLSLTDIGMFSFWIISALSTLFSQYKYDSLNGTVGRNNGLILITVYLAVYVIISRFYCNKNFVFVFLSVGMGLVCLLGLLNFFFIDPFGLFENYDEQTTLEFISTIGNKNLFSSFVCIYLPIVTSLFVIGKTKLSNLYLAGCAVGFCALMIGTSSSGYLGFFASAAIMLLLFIKNYNYFIRYIVSLFVMLLSAKIFGVFVMFFQNNKGLDEVSQFFLCSNLSFIPIFALAVIFVLCLVFKKSFEIKRFTNILFAAAVVIVAGAFSGVFAMFVYYTFIDTTTDIGSMATYFRFSDRWGTHRGFMWNKAFEIIKNSSPKELLIGTGPDTFFHAFSPYFQELSDRFNNTSTDCAHNEYLNYVITQGFLGLLAYLTFIVSPIVHAIKLRRKNPLVYIFMFPILCYMIQAVVNIAQPITTPLFIICVSLCESLYRQEKFKIE